ncbi:GIY-YIG nuclease family protein [Methylobacterium aquaticum]|uniref:GIY-YIG nuclease family protein n=1 Tax=Methylobacterium aquaticum TaxID=270351 RepID=UPI003D7766A8
MRCSDDSYYVGSARGTTLDKRLGEHQAGIRPGCTRQRRPVTLVYAEGIRSHHGCHRHGTAHQGLEPSEERSADAKRSG